MLDKITQEITNAIKIAKRAHEGQKRWNGDDYFEAHVKKVAKLTEKNFYLLPKEYRTQTMFIVSIATAYLHDVVEDSSITIDELRKLGVFSDTIRFVDNLTKRNNERYFKFIQRATKSPISMLVKICDLTCNMEDANEKEKMSARYAKYEFAKEYLESRLK